MRGIGRFLSYAKQKANEASAKKEAEKNTPTQGKQSVKELLAQGQGVTTADAEQHELRNLERIFRKYGIDYAVRKDKSEDPPRYIVFCKAKDKDALDAAYHEYAAEAMAKKSRPSVLEQLAELKQKAAERDAGEKLLKREKGERSR